VIPVTTIGGYLGAGKTTLVNHLLRHAGGQRIAVLVNEFGALPIDADLIEAKDGDLISIAGGCICCSFGNDLIGALGDLAKLDPAPDHIVIEASGVAIPSGIAASVALLPGFRLNAVVVLADAEAVRALAADAYVGDTILRQLQDADLVLATKSDLVTAPDLQETLSWLNAQAAQAAVVAIAEGRVPADLLLGPRERDAVVVESAHSDALFASCVFPASAPVDAVRLAEQMAQGAFGLVRAKGFVRDLDGDIRLIQLVGRRVSVERACAAPAQLAVVCIGRADGMDQHGLERLFAAPEA
jgi:G3E family GTPase